MASATSNGSTNTNTSGETNVEFDFSEKGVSDCISDKNMAEMVRRLKGFVTSDETGDVVFSQNPPNNQNKLWLEISNTGAHVGTVKRYKTSTGEWVDDHTELPDIPEFIIPKNFEENFTMASDDETVVINHDLADSDYFYDVVYLDEPTIESRWFEVDRASNSLTIRVKSATGVEISVRIKQNL